MSWMANYLETPCTRRSEFYQTLATKFFDSFKLTPVIEAAQ